MVARLQRAAEGIEVLMKIKLDNGETGVMISERVHNGFEPTTVMEYNEGSSRRVTRVDGQGFHVWMGYTGIRYVYRIQPFPVYMGDVRNILGNFIFARYEDGYGFVPVYVGCGNLRALFIRKPRLIRQIVDRGVTSIHVHSRLKKGCMRKEAIDIIERNSRNVCERTVDCRARNRSEVSA